MLSIPLILSITHLSRIIEHYLLTVKRSGYIPSEFLVFNFREKFLEFLTRLSIHIILQETFLWSCPRTPSCYIRFCKALGGKGSRFQLHVGFVLFAARWSVEEVGRITAGVLLNYTNVVCLPCRWGVRGKPSDTKSCHLLCMVLFSPQKSEVSGWVSPTGGVSPIMGGCAVQTCTSHQVRILEPQRLPRSRRIVCCQFLTLRKKGAFPEEFMNRCIGLNSLP